MILEPILPIKYIVIFTIFFIISLIISQLFKIKHLYLRVITFIIFLTFILNPKIEITSSEKHKDIVIIVSDMSQSVVETKKIEEVISINRDLTTQLSKIENIEQINIELTNNKILDEYNDKEIKTSLFQELNNAINDLNIDRLSGIIVITDGQIHDINNYNKFLAKIPIHYILVGNENEKDRILKVKNVPKYAVLGKKYSLSINILDNTDNRSLKTDFYLNDKLVYTEYISPNKNYKVPLPKLLLGKNILEIRTESNNKEISKINNYQIYDINGIQDKLRVMLISGEPNMGLRNIRNILNSDPNIELLHFTILRPPTKRDLTPVKELSLIPFPTQELFAADISKFNLIIFDQYGLQGILPSKYLENISKFVISGGALLDIAGRKYLTEDSLINSPIKKILPTNPLEDIINYELRPELTEIGKRHPITNRLYNNYSEKPWGKWTSFTKSQLISGKPLLQYKDAPLLVVDNVGKGRVAQILSNESWIWQKSLNDKGPLIELMRNTIQWLLKNPKLEENFIRVYKENNFIRIKLNSLSLGNINTKIITPSNETINLKLLDKGNGIYEGEFKPQERGKFKIMFRDKIKYFILNNINNREFEEITSSDQIIKSYIEKNSLDTKNFNVLWNNETVPKIIKIYNNKIISGKNWIGIVEKKIPKIVESSNKEIFNWYIIFIFLVFFIFLSWYREAKN